MKKTKGRKVSTIRPKLITVDSFPFVNLFGGNNTPKDPLLKITERDLAGVLKKAAKFMKFLDSALTETEKGCEPMAKTKKGGKKKGC